MSFDFSAPVRAPFRIQPGLRRIAAGLHQLTPLRLDDLALQAKLTVLQRHAPQALLAQPGFDPAAAATALLAHAVVEQPQAIIHEGAGSVVARHLGWSLHDGMTLHGDGSADIGRCLRDLPPGWRLSGLLSLAFAEDFALIDGDSTRIAWLAVCLPSHWAPEDKVGRSFAEAHAPVADNRLLVGGAEHLARLVTDGERWERFV